MRASFQKDLSLQDIYQISGDAAHHLVNVIRIKLGEEILLLNGHGLKVRTKVVLLARKEVSLERLDHSESERPYILDLALGIPKKEALELSLKQAVELGFRKIYLIRSQYSQTKLPENERIESLLISALEQSNSAFMPEIIPATWAEISTDEYTEILMMDSQSATGPKNPGKSTSILLIVGPEGGFSPEETVYLHKLPKARILNLPTPILRTPTAVATGAGMALESLLD